MPPVYHKCDLINIPFFVAWWQAEKFNPVRKQIQHFLKSFRRHNGQSYKRPLCYMYLISPRKSGRLGVTCRSAGMVRCRWCLHAFSMSSSYKGAESTMESRIILDGIRIDAFLVSHGFHGSYLMNIVMIIIQWKLRKLWHVEENLPCDTCLSRTTR